MEAEEGRTKRRKRKEGGKGRTTGGIDGGRRAKDGEKLRREGQQETREKRSA